MKVFIDFIRDNYEWIFSGIGVAILLYIIPLVCKKVKHIFSKPKEILTIDSDKQITKSTPKRLNSKILIDTITDNENNPNVEFSIYVRRCWYPDKRPDVKEFVKELSIEDPICFECKTPFINIGSTHYKECTGPKCSLRNNRNFQSRIRSANYNDWKLVLNTYIGKLNKDYKYFDRIWTKYYDWYLKNTNNEIHQFARPLNFSRKSYVDS